MKKPIGWITAALLLASCNTPVKERIVTQRVEVPIYQPCRPRIEPRPVYPTETKPVATDPYEQMKTALAEIALRQAREMMLEAALDGCAGQ